MNRIFSRFAIKRGDSKQMGMDVDSGFEGLDGDPRAMAHMMREMSDEMGEEIDPETNELLGRMESGEMPDDLEGDYDDSFGNDTDF